MKDEENIKERSPTSTRRYKRITELIKVGTLWSFIALPQEKGALIAAGAPIQGTLQRGQKTETNANQKHRKNKVFGASAGI